MLCVVCLLTGIRRNYPAFFYEKIPYNPALCMVELEETPHSKRRMAESAKAGKDAHSNGQESEEPEV